jgi:uncharacterized membrane protein
VGAQEIYNHKALSLSLSLSLSVSLSLSLSLALSLSRSLALSLSRSLALFLSLSLSLSLSARLTADPLRDQTLCEDEDSDVFITRTQVLGADEAQRLADEEQCPIGKSAWNKGGTWEEKDHSK